MTLNIAKEVAALERLTTSELQARYTEVFGEATRVRHRVYLVRRIAWKLQALAEGDLSERARQRADELGRNAELRSMAPKKEPASVAAPSHTLSKPQRIGADRRLPMPGTILTRTFKGRLIQATVLVDGIEYDGKVYKSLSAIAREVSGTQWNGYLFFGIAGKEKTA